MSRNAKIILAVLAGLMMICCLGVGVVGLILPDVIERTFESAVADSPEQAAEIGQGIVQYELPEGYQEESAMSVLGTSVVIISSDFGNPFIMLMSFPAAFAGDMDEMRRQIEAQSGRTVAQNFTLVEERETVINDQKVVFNVMEGVTDNGQRVRQMVGTFATQDDGTAMVMISGMVEGWDDDEVDAFIESME